MSGEGGFPIASSRGAFGPTYRNRYQPVEADKDLGAEIGNLMFWQLAGCSVVARAAWVLVTGSSGAIVAAAENWDSEAAFAPTVVRNSTGVYTVTYPALAEDMNGDEQPVAFWACRATPQSLSRCEARALVQAANRRIINIQTYTVNGTGTPTAADVDFLLELT